MALKYKLVDHIRKQFSESWLKNQGDPSRIVSLPCQSGLHGWEVTDLKVTFTQAEYYSPVSTPADFRQLTPYVFRLALQQSGVDIDVYKRQGQTAPKDDRQQQQQEKPKKKNNKGMKM